MIAHYKDETFYDPKTKFNYNIPADRNKKIIIELESSATEVAAHIAKPGGLFMLYNPQRGDRSEDPFIQEGRGFGDDFMQLDAAIGSNSGSQYFPAKTPSPF